MPTATRTQRCPRCTSTAEDLDDGRCLCPQCDIVFLADTRPMPEHTPRRDLDG